MKTKTIQLDERVVTVKKLPLGAYAELLIALDELPKYFDKLTTLKDSEILPELPKIIAACINDFANIIATGTDITQEDIKNTIGIDEATKLVLAIIEINNYAEAWENVKKIPAQLFQKPTAQPKLSQPKAKTE